MRFTCETPLQRLASNQYITVRWEDDNNVKMVKVTLSEGALSFKTETIQNFGHYTRTTASIQTETSETPSPKFSGREEQSEEAQFREISQI